MKIKYNNYNEKAILLKSILISKPLTTPEGGMSVSK